MNGGGSYHRSGNLQQQRSWPEPAPAVLSLPNIQPPSFLQPLASSPPCFDAPVPLVLRLRAIQQQLLFPEPRWEHEESVRFFPGVLMPQAGGSCRRPLPARPVNLNLAALCREESFDVVQRVSEGKMRRRGTQLHL